MLKSSILPLLSIVLIILGFYYLGTIKDDIEYGFYIEDKYKITKDLDFLQSVEQFRKKKLIEYQYQKVVGLGIGATSEELIINQMKLIDSILYDCEEKSNDTNNIYGFNYWRLHPAYYLPYSPTLLNSLDFILENDLYKDEKLNLANKLRESACKYAGTFKYSIPKIDSVTESKSYCKVTELTTGITWLIEITKFNTVIYWNTSDRIYWSISVDDQTYDKFLGKFKISYR